MTETAGRREPTPDTERLRSLVATESDETLAVRSPFTDDLVGSVPVCAPADLERAVDRAGKAAVAWRERPLAERAAVLREVGETVMAHREELLDLIQLESGKARWDALEEVLDVVATADHYADHAEAYAASERRRGVLPGLTRTEVRHKPHGVVGLVTPWNYPLTLTVSDALPALLAGNAVLMKPATETPFTALRALELLRAAGLPPAVMQVVTGRGPELGPTVVEACDYVGFTGSTAAGRELAALAGEHLTPSSMELGGNNAMVVLADANLQQAVTGALRGCFASAGQLCIAVERIYVEAGVYEEFLERFVAATAALDLGASYDYAADVGSLVSGEHLEAVDGVVQGAIEAGATLETGGERREDVGPWFYEPTVLTDVDPGLPVACEETFGPVVSVSPVADADEALERANDTPYGLNASVWTADRERGRRLARRLRAGTVGVNDAYIGTWGSIAAPMGGMDDSGMGRRHGREGFERYTETQTITSQRVHPLVPPRGVPTGLLARAVTAVVSARRYLPWWPP